MEANRTCWDFVVGLVFSRRSIGGYRETVPPKNAPDEPAGRDFFRCRPVDAAAVKEVGGVDIGLGAPEDSPPPQVANLLRNDARVRLVHRDLAYAFVKRKICTPIGGVGKTVSH